MAEKSNEKLFDEYEYALSEFLEKPNGTYEAEMEKARAAVLARMVSPGHVRFPETHQEAVAMVAICERMFPDSVPRMCGPGEVVVPQTMTDEMFNAARQVYDDDENANAVKLWNAVLAAVAVALTKGEGK